MQRALGLFNYLYMLLGTGFLFLLQKRNSLIKQ